MKWVTWEHVGIDRMACAWLIRRWIDKDATLEFVSAQAPLPDDAEPFDIPDVRLSHHQGHCSFHAFLREYKIKDSALQRISRIIDEADTIQEVSVEASAPGLDLICEGLRLISKDDHEAIARASMIYDAVYAKLAKESTR